MENITQVGIGSVKFQRVEMEKEYSLDGKKWFSLKDGESVTVMPDQLLHWRFASGQALGEKTGGWKPGKYAGGRIGKKQRSKK